MAESMCGIRGCDRPRRALGMCLMHYQRCRKLGHPGIAMPKTPEERFHAKIEKLPNGCWQWTGHLTAWGYGYIGVNGKSIRAHRFAYQLLIGPIPEGMHLDHLCRNRGCVNPDHLEPVTPRENQRRGNSPTGVNYRKTHCNAGHDLAVHGEVTANGYRVCRICRRATWERWRVRQRAKKAGT